MGYSDRLEAGEGEGFAVLKESKGTLETWKEILKALDDWRVGREQAGRTGKKVLKSLNDWRRGWQPTGRALPQYGLEVAPTADAVQRAIPKVLPFVMAGGLVLAAFGQYVLSSDFPRFSTRGPVLMAAGGALFLVAWMFRGRTLEGTNMPLEEDGDSLPEGTSFHWGSRQTAAVVLGALGGVYGFTQNDHNTFTLLGVVPWLLGVLALVWGFWPPISWKFRPLKINSSWLWTALVLAFIIALATFLRFYRLYDAPRDMTGDLVGDIFLIRDLWERGLHLVYFVPNREPLKLYAVAPLTSVWGYSFLSLKILSASAGVVAVPVVYIMARELFENKKVALLAAALFSLSYLNILSSRGGFRDSLGVLAFSLVLVFLFRALKFGRTHDFIFAGLALGAALYTYAGLRVLPMAVGLVLLISLLSRLLLDRRQAPVFLVNAVLLVIASLIVFAPLARFVADEPDLFVARSQELAEPPWESSLETLAANVKNTALIFNWTSEVWPARLVPVLDYGTGSLLPLGFAMMLIGWAFWRKSLYGHAAVIFLVVLTPDYVKREGVLYASGLHVGHVIPLAVAFAALPLYVTAEQIAKVVGKRWPVIVLPALGATLGVIGFVNHQLYFDDWVSAHRQAVDNTSEVAGAVRDFVDSGGSLENAYVKPIPHWMGVGGLQIEVGDLDWQGVLGFEGIEVAVEHATNPDPKLYVFHHTDEETLLRLREIYPEGTFKRIPSELHPIARDFFIFEVPTKVRASDKSQLVPTELDGAAIRHDGRVHGPLYDFAAAPR